MLHASRQLVRYALLSIGFLLFFFITIHEAKTVNDRKAVEGKRLFPTSQVVTLVSQGSISSSENAVRTPASVADTGESTGFTVSPALSPGGPKNSNAHLHAEAASATTSSEKTSISPKPSR